MGAFPGTRSKVWVAHAARRRDPGNPATRAAFESFALRSAGIASTGRIHELLGVTR